MEHPRQKCVLRATSGTTSDSCSLGISTIEPLSDDIILCVFDSYRQELEDSDGTWPWHVLTHICQRWRRIIFACPVHLNLQLECKSRTDAKAALDLWPTLPIIIKATFNRNRDEDDIIGALEYRDRIAGITLWNITTHHLQKCLPLMQETFPILTYLFLYASHNKESAFLITDAFLGESAPRLQKLDFSGIRFPALPNFLSSASNLVDLTLGQLQTTGSGHMSPEAMALSLSVLTRLRSLNINFRWRSSYLTSQGPPPSTHALPALTRIMLEGPHGYLDDLVARIDAPLLDSGCIRFYDEPTFDAPRLPNFIHRTERFKSPGLVSVYLRHASAFLSLHSSVDPESANISLTFPFDESHTPVEILVKIGIQCSALLSHVERLEIGGDDLYFGPWWRQGNELWLEFLRPFTAVQTLHLAGEDLLPHLAGILGAVMGKRAAHVLPALHTILLSDSEPKYFYDNLLKQFIVAREHSEHPVVVELENLSVSD
jgi:hypothetical protein